MFHGFEEGYLQMNALTAFVFGIIVINAIKEKGAQSGITLLLTGINSSLLSAIILAAIYASLANIGATSVEGLGYFAKGGEVRHKLILQLSYKVYSVRDWAYTKHPVLHKKRWLLWSTETISWVVNIA